MTLKIEISNSIKTTQIAHGLEADLKTASIRAQVLQTIRSHMPIGTLFRPDVKIDLALFAKDQILLRNIAEFIASCDGTDVAKHFEGSELLAVFKDFPHYLKLIYEACSDVLNQKSFPYSLKSAIEGRIFTLKNALIAQHSPEALRKSQVQNKMAPQAISAIKEEGANFIRESLRLHLQVLKTDESSSFRECLTANAEQLIPFVQKITCVYIRESGYSCPDNPLTFRNPKGRNPQGLIAASVMEACLNALGYTTRTIGRCDLEPRVTLATRHSLVEVTGPDHVKYIIDPCYLQFHQDIGIENLPTASVLVLQESEVDAYIENNIMIHWKANFRRICANDEALRQKLAKQDQLISYIIGSLLPKEVAPSNPEDWVRNGFKRVWGISTYSPILYDEGFQGIFNGLGQATNTYNAIKPMGISSMTHHLSSLEIESRLDALVCEKDRHSTEALPLLGQLPKSKRGKYSSLLDLDPRLQKVDITLNAYFRSLKKVVNLQGKELSVVYGCSGQDCTTVLFATDANDLTFVDLTEVTFSEFEQALTWLRVRSSSSECQIHERLKNSGDFFVGRELYMGAMSAYVGPGKHHMYDLALKLLFDLRETGVDLDHVTLTAVESGVRIDFSWQYHGADTSRKRSITLLTADITKPGSYPTLLQQKLKEGIDVFYMKGAYSAPLVYPRFLPHIARSINPGGWLMTTDKTSTMESVNPEQLLKQNNLTFALHKSEETRNLEKIMQPSHNPFASVPSLQMYPSEQRFNRMVGSDLTYWAILNLRQKT